jgi:hypothetical protein
MFVETVQSEVINPLSKYQPIPLVLAGKRVGRKGWNRETGASVSS